MSVVPPAVNGTTSRDLALRPVLRRRGINKHDGGERHRGDQDTHVQSSWSLKALFMPAR